MKCKYCQRERTCSARSHEENPFCNECLHERVEKAAAERGPVEVVELEDGYVLVRSIQDGHQGDNSARRVRPEEEAALHQARVTAMVKEIKR